jgi:hypothetical protein
VYKIDIYNKTKHMNAYFFNTTPEERENILDQHKKLYDGYVTKYNQESNMTPLYVQDLANDKGGVTINNKGEVSQYKNLGINESPLDKIADGPTDLENGTVDLDNATNDKSEVDSILMHDRYPSPVDEEDSFDEYEDEMEMNNDQYEYDIDELEDYSAEDISEDLFTEIEEEILPDFMSQINESLDMFKRFKKYN